MFKPSMVFYHDPCIDGCSAAGVVLQYYKEQNNHIKPDDIEFVPANYGNVGDVQALINRVRDQTVLLVDYTFKPDVLEAISQSATSIVILDHHKTAQADLENLAHIDNSLTVQTVEDATKEHKIVAQFVMEECGTSLSWKFFFSNREPPRFIDYVRDIDLGIMKLQSSPAFRGWSRSKELNPEDFEIFLRNYETEEKISKIVDAGEAINDFAQNRMKQLWNEVRIGTVGGIEFPYVFTDYAFASDAANSFLAKGYRLAIAFYATKTSFGASLRSTKDLDCSAIAKQFGGGGHAQASGFNIPLADVSDFFKAAVASRFIEDPSKKDDE